MPTAGVVVPASVVTIIAGQRPGKRTWPVRQSALDVRPWGGLSPQPLLTTSTRTMATPISFGTPACGSRAASGTMTVSSRLWNECMRLAGCRYRNFG